MATTRISDVVVPEIFGPYVQNLTTELSELIRSGAVSNDAVLSDKLSGGGLTFNEPSWRDLANEEENTSNDDPADKSTPSKTGSLNEVQVRLSRNFSWSTMDLSGTLAGSDPMQSIASRVAYYWTRRQQALFIATAQGVFANDALPTDANHIQNEMTLDVSGASFVNGVTNFTTEGYLDALQTMGDAQKKLGVMMVHSVVLTRMKKNNLIDFIPDARGEVLIPTFQGKLVIEDDSMPHDKTTGLFDTWIFGAGAFRFGSGSAPVPVAVERDESAGHGGGQEILYNRVEWCMAPAGYAYIGSLAEKGGPKNAVIKQANSWQRVFPERKQIKMVRYVTREF